LDLREGIKKRIAIVNSKTKAWTTLVMVDVDTVLLRVDSRRNVCGY